MSCDCYNTTDAESPQFSGSSGGDRYLAGKHPKLDCGPGTSGSGLDCLKYGTLDVKNYVNVSPSSTTFIMATTEWKNPPNADVILRTSDGKEFAANKLVLSLASSVFKDMFPIPPASSEKESPQLPVIDVHDPPEALEIFLQIIYPVRNPPIKDLETLASVLKLADKYGAIALLDASNDYLASVFANSPPIHIYMMLCVCGREEEAESFARRVPFASLGSLSGPLLRLITTQHYHQLVQFMVARAIQMRLIVDKHLLSFKRELATTFCNDRNHLSYSQTICAVIQAAFEANPDVQTAEALGRLFDFSIQPFTCRDNCPFIPPSLKKKAEGLLGELVEMAKTLPWDGQGWKAE